MLAEARATHPDIACHLTGDVVMNRVFADTTQDEMRTLAPPVFVIIAVAAVLLLRPVFGTLALVVTLAAAPAADFLLLPPLLIAIDRDGS